jgi:hypothetical protein
VLCAEDVINEPFAVINADDFYGADAFKIIYSELNSMQGDRACMVGYHLKNTVSENGAVTRGICTINESELSSVKEVYKITVDKNRVIMDSELGVLDPEAVVSMNMWGFLPSVFKDMKKSFENFLRGVKEDDIKAEYVLSTMIDGFIREKKLCVGVLPTDSVWFGVTYKEDKLEVSQKLADMHSNGVYPDKLF